MADAHEVRIYGANGGVVHIAADGRITATQRHTDARTRHLRVKPFLKLSGWSKSTLYRINQRHLLLIKVDNATFVDLKAWRKYMAACPRVGGVINDD